MKTLSKEDKLKTIIQHAIDGGWKWGKLFTTNELNTWQYGNDCIYEWDEVHHINTIFFRHDFAKAFWGDEKEHFLFRSYRGGFYAVDEPTSTWQHHLQQLATTPEEDRIDYLYQFIETT